nr:hypothetical protein BaRGS_032180 [Batillaria attramentaria]
MDIGRSIALLDSSSAVVACATVESAQEYATATAVFRSKVLGHVTFRQVKTLPAALTQVASDLYFDGCAIGDLSGKLGNVGVGVVRGSRRKTAADLHLPVTGTNQISGHILLLSSGTDTVACATIRLHQARSGVATFDNDGVTGTVTLTQPSPLDPATAVVKLSNLRSLAGGYHVHEWPVPQRAVASQQLCSGGSVAGHFNPFGIIYDSDSPAAATSTEDMYEVGDLSRKYGMLNGLTELDKTYTDWNLQLFGPNSVLGRSLVIHNDTAGTPRWICTNIHDTAALTVAMATFTYPVIGYVMFQQRQGEEFAETTIYTRLDYGDGSVTATSGHAWGIHASPVSSDMVSSDVNTRCVSGGDRISPYGVSGTNYATQCTSSAQLRCGLGDLGGKHGKLSVRSASGAPAISFGTDVNLPLTGDNSIVGKSVVLMSASGGNSRLACASVIRVTPRHAKVDSWGSTSYGSVSFTQASGVIQQPTTISFNLQSLPETTSGNAYRIHDGSVSSSSSASDRCGNVGSVYDPFSVTPASGGVVTKDKVPVGDLAAKFGLLMQADVSKTVQDPSLDLFGLRSVVGRAMTLSSSENVFACGDVMGAVQEGGMLVEAEAVFSGDVIGKVMMVSG